MAAFVSPGQTVVIKPNLTANAPEDSGGTTHVALVEALVRQVQVWSPGRVVVAEGTGMFGLEHETAFPRQAWREMAARTGVELYNLDAGPHTTLRVPDGRFGGELPIASPAAGRRADHRPLPQDAYHHRLYGGAQERLRPRAANHPHGVHRQYRVETRPGRINHCVRPTWWWWTPMTAPRASPVASVRSAAGAR